MAAFERGFATALRDNAGISQIVARPGFAVYLNTIASGAIEALKASFPTVAMLIGEEAFGRVAGDFHRALPPVSPVLAAYGDGFAEFIARQDWLAELPYIADVARIDRMRAEAHIAEDAEPFAFSDLEGLATYDWMTLRLPLHPACRFGWFTTPATSIWLAHANGEPDCELEPEWTAEGVLVTRPLGAVSTVPIDRGEHRLLFGLWLGETIGEAASAAVTSYPNTDVSTAFARLITSGALLAPKERT